MQRNKISKVLNAQKKLEIPVSFDDALVKKALTCIDSKSETQKDVCKQTNVASNNISKKVLSSFLFCLHDFFTIFFVNTNENERRKK